MAGEEDETVCAMAGKVEMDEGREGHLACFVDQHVGELDAQQHIFLGSSAVGCTLVVGQVVPAAQYACCSTRHDDDSLTGHKSWVWQVECPVHPVEVAVPVEHILQNNAPPDCLFHCLPCTYAHPEPKISVTHP